MSWRLQRFSFDEEEQVIQFGEGFRERVVVVSGPGCCEALKRGGKVSPVVRVQEREQAVGALLRLFGPAG